MRVQKLSYSSIFIKNNNNLYSRFFFFPYIIELFSVFAVKDKQRKKIDTSYLVCIFFFFCCLLPKYKNFVTHYWYSYLGWNFCLQRCHCMTTDLCSSFETDMLRPLPPRPRPAQAHKCLKNTRLSAGASVKTVLSTHLTKPGSRKEKAEREKALFSVQQQLEDTRQTRKKKRLQKCLMGQGAPFCGSSHVLFSLV